jgi:hypothetical protein
MADKLAHAGRYKVAPGRISHTPGGVPVPLPVLSRADRVDR